MINTSKLKQNKVLKQSPFKHKFQVHYFFIVLKNKVVKHCKLIWDGHTIYVWGFSLMTLALSLQSLLPQNGKKRSTNKSNLHNA